IPPNSRSKRLFSGPIREAKAPIGLASSLRSPLGIENAPTGSSSSRGISEGFSATGSSTASTGRGDVGNGSIFSTSSVSPFGSRLQSNTARRQQTRINEMDRIAAPPVGYAANRLIVPLGVDPSAIGDPRIVPISLASLLLLR